MLGEETVVGGWRWFCLGAMAHSLVRIGMSGAIWDESSASSLRTDSRVLSR